MATASLPRLLVSVVISLVVVHFSEGAHIPEIRLLTDEDDGRSHKDGEMGAASGFDQQPLVLESKKVDIDEPVFIVFVQENQQKSESEDAKRYFYDVVDTLKQDDRLPLRPINDLSLTNGKFPPAAGNGDAAQNPTAVKATEKAQSPAEDSKEEEEGFSVLQLNARNSMQIEENVPGFPNYPKHIPEHLKPISPFADDYHSIGKGQGFFPERSTKRDEAFIIPSDSLPPPPRAGPYLYPESIADREYRIPFD